MGRLFDHIFVDESPDIDRLQSSVLPALKPIGLGLTVAGDGARSISRFSTTKEAGRSFVTSSTAPWP